jgi:small neutral amino acid transporter SnatA (MarC family)
VGLRIEDAILKWTGMALQVFTVVLGVTQIALGLQIITQSLGKIGVFVECAN